MALFEYRCSDCGNVSEHLVYSAEDKLSCPDCGSDKLEKLLSTFAVNAKSSPSCGPAHSCPHAGHCGGGGGGCGMM